MDASSGLIASCREAMMRGLASVRLSMHAKQPVSEVFSEPVPLKGRAWEWLRVGPLTQPPSRRHRILCWYAEGLERMSGAVTQATHECTMCRHSLQNLVTLVKWSGSKPELLFLFSLLLLYKKDP